jgi:hypothetical protein
MENNLKIYKCIFIINFKDRKDLLSKGHEIVFGKIVKDQRTNSSMIWFKH